jgi:hypothetical protein
MKINIKGSSKINTNVSLLVLPETKFIAIIFKFSMSKGTLFAAVVLPLPSILAETKSTISLTIS